MNSAKMESFDENISLLIEDEKKSFLKWNPEEKKKIMSLRENFWVAGQD